MSRNLLKPLSLIFTSETRWLDYFLNLAIYNTWKFTKQHTKFSKLGSHFCQILNYAYKIAKRLLTLSQSSEISPNLVTLILTHVILADIRMSVLQTVVENHNADSFSGKSKLAINLNDAKVNVIRFAEGTWSTIVLGSKLAHFAEELVFVVVWNRLAYLCVDISYFDPTIESLVCQLDNWFVRVP